MAQDDSATNQIAQEAAESITEEQRQHLRRRLQVDAVPPVHEDQVDNKPIAPQKDHRSDRHDRKPDPKLQDPRDLMATANFPDNPPPQGLQLACSHEIVKFCFPEAAKAISVYRTSTSHDDVRLALLNVSMCLARSSELLSQPCVAALVETLQLPPMPMPTPMSLVDWSPSSTPGKSGDSRGDSNDRQPTKERGRFHHNRRFRHDDDDSDDHDGSGGCHPLVWAFVLPFFFLGLFVATKKGLKLFRKWYAQQQLTQSGGDAARSEDYAPLKTQEPS